MVLLDSNIFIALCSREHAFSKAAHRWYETEVTSFALCAVVEGSWIRTAIRMFGKDGVKFGLETLNAYRSLSNCEFWPDTLSYAEIDLSGVIGRKQVTDAYLAGLAKSKNAKLATFDLGLAALRPDVVSLVPV